MREIYEFKINCIWNCFSLLLSKQCIRGSLLHLFISERTFRRKNLKPLAINRDNKCVKCRPKALLDKRRPMRCACEFSPRCVVCAVCIFYQTINRTTHILKEPGRPEVLFVPAFNLTRSAEPSPIWRLLLSASLTGLWEQREGSPANKDNAFILKQLPRNWTIINPGELQLLPIIDCSFKCVLSKADVTGALTNSAE